MCIEGSMTVSTNDKGRCLCHSRPGGSLAPPTPACTPDLHNFSPCCRGCRTLPASTPAAPLPTTIAPADVALAQRDAVELVADRKPLYLQLAAGEQGAHFMLIEVSASLSCKPCTAPRTCTAGGFAFQFVRCPAAADMPPSMFVPSCADEEVRLSPYGERHM